MLVELTAAVVTMVFRHMVDKYLTAAPVAGAFSAPQAAGLVAVSGTLLYVYRRLRNGQPFKISLTLPKNLRRSCRSRNKSRFYPNNSREELMKTTSECLEWMGNGSTSNLSWKSASSIRLPEEDKGEPGEEKIIKSWTASSDVSVKSSLPGLVDKKVDFCKGDCKRHKRLINRSQGKNGIIRRTRSGRTYSMYI